MDFDAPTLADFYESPMGQVARRLILRRVRLLWPTLANRRVLGYGFAVPYLRSFIGEAERVVAAMPAQIGVVAWPAVRQLVTLAEEDALPFPDAFFDCLLVVHGLEGADAMKHHLRELWRVMAPEGKLIVVAPNRTSLWAQVERSPFAHGRPFTRSQLDRLLRDAMFEPERWDISLLQPPLKSRRLIRTGTGWDRVGRALWPALAGAHIVEAQKTVFGAVPVGKLRQSKTKYAPA
ncbi:MAG TPA: methyltransferase domain-containing protein [Rhizomicrobium sp.]|jgi:SAM-dependent methyltransferase